MPNSKSARMKGLVTHRSDIYGIMGGLYNRKISGRSSTNRVTSRLVIPPSAAAGLRYMRLNNILSKNPLGSGGVGKMFRLRAGGSSLGSHLGRHSSVKSVANLESLDTFECSGLIVKGECYKPPLVGENGWCANVDGDGDLNCDDIMPPCTTSELHACQREGVGSTCIDKKYCQPATSGYCGISAAKISIPCNPCQKNSECNVIMGETCILNASCGTRTMCPQGERFGNAEQGYYCCISNTYNAKTTSCSTIPHDTSGMCHLSTYGGTNNCNIPPCPTDTPPLYTCSPAAGCMESRSDGTMTLAQCCNNCPAEEGGEDDTCKPIRDKWLYSCDQTTGQCSQTKQGLQTESKCSSSCSNKDSYICVDGSCVIGVGGKALSECKINCKKQPPINIPEKMVGFYYYVNDCAAVAADISFDLLKAANTIFIAFACTPNKESPCTSLDEPTIMKVSPEVITAAKVIKTNDPSMCVMYSIGGEAGSSNNNLYTYIKNTPTEDIAKSILNWDYVDGIDWDFEGPASRMYYPLASKIASISKLVRKGGKNVTIACVAGIPYDICNNLCQYYLQCSDSTDINCVSYFYQTLAKATMDSGDQVIQKWNIMVYAGLPLSPSGPLFSAEDGIHTLNNTFLKGPCSLEGLVAKDKFSVGLWGSTEISLVAEYTSDFVNNGIHNVIIWNAIPDGCTQGSSSPTNYMDWKTNVYDKIISAAVPAFGSYTVKDGDTCYSIANAQCQDGNDYATEICNAASVCTLLQVGATIKYDCSKTGAHC